MIVGSESILCTGTSETSVSAGETERDLTTQQCQEEKKPFADPSEDRRLFHRFHPVHAAPEGSDRQIHPGYLTRVKRRARRTLRRSADELRRATELNKNEATPHYHLARVYDRLGNPQAAAAERDIHKQLTGSGKTQ